MYVSETSGVRLCTVNREKKKFLSFSCELLYPVLRLDKWTKEKSWLEIYHQEFRKKWKESF
jgi:hypothetical protein